MKAPIAPLVLVGLTAATCQTVTKAPEGTPRVEVEVAVVVGDDFLDALTDVDADSALVQRIQEKVMSMADVGLRFYPILSSSYEEGQPHPDYLLTVEVRQLEVVYANKMIEEEGQDPRIESKISKIICRLGTSFERRRENAPALVVGRANTTYETSGEKNQEVMAAKQGYPAAETPASGESLKVMEKDILTTVDGALERALKAIQPNLDRELSQLASPAGSGT